MSTNNLITSSERNEVEVMRVGKNVFVKNKSFADAGTKSVERTFLPPFRRSLTRLSTDVKKALVCWSRRN